MQTMIETPTEQTLREQAIERIEKRREFQAHLLAYVLTNTFLIAIWALTTGGFFWPMFPMAGWGIGLFFHGWAVYTEGPSERAIEHEIQRLKR